jgi:hypothetical protein
VRRSAAKLAILVLLVGGIPASAQENVADLQGRVRSLEEQVRTLTDENRTLRERLSAAEASAPSPAEEQGRAGEGADRYKPGWITKAFLAPKTNAELGNIPRDPIAVYVTTSDPHPFSGYVEHHGLALTDPVAYLREGYLRVTEAGRYSFVSIADLSKMGSDVAFCAARLELNETPILDAKSPAVGLGKAWSETAGLELEPGFYRLRHWIACRPQQLRFPEGTAIELRIKGPSDTSPRRISGADVVHKEGG